MKRLDIHSRCSPGVLLHVILFGGDYPEGREDISTPDRALQVSIINAPPGKIFKAHRHIPKACPPEQTTEEMWLVERGSVRVAYFDLNNAFLEEVALVAGDKTLTLAGGHEYRAGPEGVQVTEVKSGPYFGQAADKVFL